MKPDESHSDSWVKQFYLTHSTDENNLIGMINDGYIYSGIYANRSRLFGSPTSRYVYLSLLGDISSNFQNITLFLSDRVLFNRSFRYAFGWFTEDALEKTIKVDHKRDNVLEHLESLNDHILKSNNVTSHEILLKKKVNLDKYLVAVCCKNNISSNTINLIKSIYPKVKILDNNPISASNLYEMMS